MSSGKTATPTGTTKKATGTNPATPMTEADQDMIRQKAYEKWQSAGCPASDGVEFWLAAEREMTGSDVTITQLPGE